MSISYDPEIDALNLRRLEGKPHWRTVRLKEGSALNVGTGKKVVGKEMLDAQEVLGSRRLSQAVVDNMTLAGEWPSRCAGRPSRPVT